PKVRSVTLFIQQAVPAVLDGQHQEVVIIAKGRRFGIQRSDFAPAIHAAFLAHFFARQAIVLQPGFCFLNCPGTASFLLALVLNRVWVRLGHGQIAWFVGRGCFDLLLWFLGLWLRRRGLQRGEFLAAGVLGLDELGPLAVSLWKVVELVRLGVGGNRVLIRIIFCLFWGFGAGLLRAHINKHQRDLLLGRRPRSVLFVHELGQHFGGPHPGRQLQALPQSKFFAR